MAAVVRETRDKERAIAARRAAEARAAAEVRRLETIAAARAARAAEKERHRRDAELLKEAKAKKAAEAGGSGSNGNGSSVSPYGAAEGKENSPEGKVAEEESGDKAPSTGSAAHDTKAAIVNVNAEQAEVLAMAPGCGLRPFNFERVFDSDAKQASSVTHRPPPPKCERKMCVNVKCGERRRQRQTDKQTDRQMLETPLSHRRVSLRHQWMWR